MDGPPRLIQLPDLRTMRRYGEHIERPWQCLVWLLDLVGTRGGIFNIAGMETLTANSPPERGPPGGIEGRGGATPRQPQCMTLGKLAHDS